jgi:hypothetical protein
MATLLRVYAFRPQERRKRPDCPQDISAVFIVNSKTDAEGSMNRYHELECIDRIESQPCVKERSVDRDAFGAEVSQPERGDNQLPQLGLEIVHSTGRFALT